MPIGFLNPALLLGLLGAGVPVLVHLLGRRQARPRAFAAIDFLLQSEKRLATRRRLRHLLLLLARIALISAVVLALARPLFRGGIVAGSGQPVSAIIVLDRTASMSMKLGNDTVFDHAKRLVIETLEGLPSGSEACVITIAARPRRMTAGFVTTSDAIRQIRQLRVGLSAGLVGDAFAEVDVVASAARRSTAIVYVASDLQQSTWSRFSAPQLGNRNLQLFVLDVRGDGVSDDVALVAADLVAGESNLAIQATRASNGTATDTFADQFVELRIADQLVNRGMLTFGKLNSAATQLALTTATAADATSAGVVADIQLTSADNMPANDRRFVYLDPARVVRVLLADGAPHADLQQDEVFYLERALQADGTDLSVRVVDASAGAWSDHEPVDVIVLANVATLDPATRRRIELHVEAGGGLLVTAGEQVTASTLLAQLGTLLPATAKSMPTTRATSDSFMLARSQQGDHPVLMPFDSSQAAQSLTAARFRKALEVEPTAEATVVLAFASGMPALIEAARGDGRVMLWTSTIDRGWNDLAVKPAYVPLVGRIVRYLGGALEPPRTRDWRIGLPINLRVDRAADHAREPVRLHAPDGTWLETTKPHPEQVEIEQGVSEPGAYLGYVGEKRVPAYDFVANLDPSESDHTRITNAALNQQLGPDAAVTVIANPDAANPAAANPAAANPAAHREDEAALPVLVLVAIAVLVEALLGRQRRVEKESV